MFAAIAVERRPDQMADTLLGRFTLDQEIARFPPGEDASGRRAETLVKTDRLRVVLVTLRAGSALQEHTARAPITIQALRGRLVATVAGHDYGLAPGELIALDADVPHSVRADEEGAFLLTMAWG
jgi:quercetin dioxygenase-like cupin family protein